MFARTYGLAKAATTAALLACCSFAHAVYDPTYLSLTYTQPTGTVSATEDIPISITLTLAADAPETYVVDLRQHPSVLLANGGPTQGEYWDDAESRWVSAEFAAYNWVELQVGITCTGTLVGNTVCENGPYTIAAFGSTGFGFNLAPGESVTFANVVTLTPRTGSAPAGTYTQSGMVLTIAAYGVDAEGHNLNGQLNVFSTGEFSRTVIAVPEAESIVLLLAGLATLGLARKKLN